MLTIEGTVIRIGHTFDGKSETFWTVVELEPCDSLCDILGRPITRIRVNDKFLSLNSKLRITIDEPPLMEHAPRGTFHFGSWFERLRR